MENGPKCKCGDLLYSDSENEDGDLVSCASGCPMAERPTNVPLGKRHVYQITGFNEPTWTAIKSRDWIQPDGTMIVCDRCEKRPASFQRYACCEVRCGGGDTFVSLCIPCRDFSNLLERRGRRLGRFADHDYYTNDNHSSATTTTTDEEEGVTRQP